MWAKNLVRPIKPLIFALANKTYRQKFPFTKGEMVEWSITAVLKTAVLRGTGGSNPSLSAKVSVTSCTTTSYADFLFNGAPNLD